MNAARHEPKDLGPLFQPRSVAIVGCSPIESGKLGSWPLRNLLIQQSKVAIYPVNPKYREIEALRSYPSLDALPEPPDVVLVMLPAEQSLAALAEADRIGARAAIVFGAGFGETEAGKALERELAALAAKTRMPICGPNTDGIINVIDGIPCGFPPYAAITPRPVGDVAVVSQSGALVSSLVMRLQRHKLGLTFSCAIGNAIDVGLADYVAHLADEPRTSSILVYVEGVGDAPAFVAAAQRAIAAGKLVAVMKGGRSDVGSAAVRSHTGSMVGAYEAFAALCHAHGIVTADSFEQLAALPLLAPVARHVDPSHARRVGVLSGSGAISSHLVDKATEHGFEVPELAPETTSRLRKRFTFTEPRNPIDLTGQVVHDPQLHVDVLDALGADPGIGIVLAGLLYGPVDITDRMKRELVEAARTTPIVAYSAEGADARDEPILASGGVPIVASADLLLSSLDKLLVAGASRRAASGGERDEVRRRAALTLLGAQTSGDAVPPETAWALL
ncbi:MAG TPA: CoA-binding protein, partial [Acidimicrobiales bacterium]